jgi:hypothetical protein
MDYSEDAVPEQVMHDDAMWDAFHSMGIGFEACLIHPVNGPCIWLKGEGENGPANFYVDCEVIQELLSHGLIKHKREGLLPSGIEEGYELSDVGRQLFGRYKDMPFDQGRGEFVSQVRSVQRKPGASQTTRNH